MRSVPYTTVYVLTYAYVFFKFTVRIHHLYGGLYVECCYFSYDESGLWVALNVIGSFFYLFNQTETKFLQISAGLDFTIF